MIFTGKRGNSPAVIFRREFTGGKLTRGQFSRGKLFVPPFATFHRASVYLNEQSKLMNKPDKNSNNNKF